MIRLDNNMKYILCIVAFTFMANADAQSGGVHLPFHTRAFHAIFGGSAGGHHHQSTNEDGTSGHRTYSAAKGHKAHAKTPGDTATTSIAPKRKKKRKSGSDNCPSD